MRNLFIILFSLFYLLGHSQDPIPPGYTPVKGYPYFVKDAKGKIIGADIAGAFSALSADTTSESLVQPPDTIQSFTVTKAATDTFSSLTREIRSYWTSEEASGNAIDSVGTVDLPVFGSVTRQQAGKIGNCNSFTSPSYLGPVDTYFEFDGSFHIGCFFSTTSTTAWDALMSCFGASNYGWELLSVGNPTRVIYWRMRYSGGDATIIGTTDINDGAFYRVDASYNAVDDTMKLWINGVLEGSIKNTNGTWYSASTYFHIGSRLAGGYFEGKIDEPATWNRELTEVEIDSLVAESQYPFPYQGSGGKSVRIQNTGFDSRADSVRIIANPIGEGKSSSRTDGTLLLAFNMADSAAYNDTTIHWPYLKDTIYIIEAYTGLWPEDIWTLVANYDTTLVDSSDISPPDQDIGIWDTIFYEDFEQHTDAPLYYDHDLFVADGWNAIYYNQQDNYRGSDNRYPQWYNDNLKDSIVIDPIAESKALRLSFASGIHQGYDGQLGRGGDLWRSTLDDTYEEVYISYNIMLRPGWDWSKGGKLGPGLYGGTFSTNQQPQVYGEGFRYMILFGWDENNDLDGNPGFYIYYQDQPNQYGYYIAWDDFQPTGVGLNYNATGRFIFDVADFTWYNITVRCVVNTFTGETSDDNGILEGYINGQLVVQSSGLYLITYPDRNNLINLIYFYQAFGGGGPPLRDEWSLLDDIWIFTYDISVDVPRGNELSEPGRVLSLPGEHKWE